MTEKRVRDGLATEERFTYDQDDRLIKGDTYDIDSDNMLAFSTSYKYECAEE